MLVMKLLPMPAAAFVPPAHGLRVNSHQASCPFDAGTFTQMLAHGNSFLLRDLAVPQSCVLALTEFFPAVSAAQEADPSVSAIFFPDDEIVSTSLAVKLAFWVDTC